MNPKAAIEILPKLMNTGRPVFLWGAPGLGKSAIVKAAAKADSRAMHDVRVVLLDPVDLRGIPQVKDGRTRWAPPEFLPTEDRSVLFLDELPQAAPLVQSACLSLLLDRTIGEYRLPDGACVIAAGNRSEDRAGAHRVLSPILNRAIHIDVEASHADWLAWAITNDVLPVVRSFVQFKPSLLSEPVPADGSRAWPTPRSWHCVSDAIKQCGVQSEIIKGIVGPTAASEFCAFNELQKYIPDIDDIVLDPDQATVPTSASVMYGLCGALVERLKTDDEMADAMMFYARRLPSEFQTMLVRDAFSVKPERMRQNKHAKQWAMQNARHLIQTTA